LVLPTYFKIRNEEREARALQEKAIRDGLHEPVSIRPYVDLSKCMGSGSCIRACPEQAVLQIIGGVAEIVRGSHCVGHGACEAACPVGAIQLEFGSERRGVELPSISPDFETNVPGIYIAGELGGMGLVANAVEQGAQGVRNLRKTVSKSVQTDVDVLIVGAGPAGLGAALEAKRSGLSYRVLEQGEFGGAIRHFPRQKLVMTRPIDFPGYKKVKIDTIRKEELIALFEEVVAETGLVIHDHERVDSISPAGEGAFTVKTSKGSVLSQKVIIAVGRAGTPRKLNVPGEHLEKVAYRLLDPEMYQHQHILVVGGGDSALEAACSLAEQAGNRVTLSYRKAVVNRAKAANISRMKAMASTGSLKLVFGSTVSEIYGDRVSLQQGEEPLVIANDQVFIFAGGILPFTFLENAGIQIETHFGKRVVVRERTK
jgi:thioredoxin reductase (NADPH)